MRARLIACKLVSGARNCGDARCEAWPQASPIKARRCAQAAAPKEENRYSMQSESVAHARKVRASESCG